MGTSPAPAVEAADRSAARLRAIEDRDVSALASLAEQGGDKRFWSLFCHECDEVLSIQGTARTVAEVAYQADWQIDVWGNVNCAPCANREEKPSDDDVRADEYYDELKDRL